MKLFTRIICLLLVCCFIGMTMISCKKDKQNGDNDGENSDNSSNQTEKQTNEYGEESFSTVVPTKDLDFEGERLTILIRDNVQNSREWTKETTEDELDEAIAMRNSAVADTLNVQVVFELIPSPSHDAYIQGLNSMITTDVDSDMHYYDIGCNFSYYCTSSVLRGYSANLLDDVWFPYFDFSLPCWNQAIVEDTTFNDRLHYVAGDINLSMFDAAIVMWHNKTLYDAKREDNDPENIQDLALAGLWTYEDLYRWASVFYENSNGTEGRQVDDTYALCMYTNDPCPVDALPYAWDLEFVIENNDKTHNFNTKKQRTLLTDSETFSMQSELRRMSTSAPPQPRTSQQDATYSSPTESSGTPRTIWLSVRWKTSTVFFPFPSTTQSRSSTVLPLRTTTIPLW